MKNSEKINLKISNTSGSKISEQELALRSKAIFYVWTHSDVVNFIETNFEDDSIKDELIKIAKKYPHSAYPNFIKNIQKTVNMIVHNRSEAIDKNYIRPVKNKIAETNIQDIKQELSIEDEINLELNNENSKNIKEELEKEF